MNHSRKLLQAATVTVCAAMTTTMASMASATLIYNPVVTMIGDSTASVSGQGRTTTLRIYANSMSNQLLSEASFASGASAGRLVNSISATSEGLLSNNPGTADAAAAGTAYSGTIYTYSAGYDAANQTSNVNSTAVNADRVAGDMNASNNTLSSATIGASQSQANAYDNNNIRSATGNDSATKFWTGGTATTSGTKGSWRYFNTNAQMDTTVTNVRATEIRNGQLFGSTGSGTRGIYAVGSGLPESGPGTSLVLATGQSSSPYEFVMIDDPNNPASTASTYGFDTIYLTDDSAIASGGGIQKWTFNGSAWGLAYTMTDGAQGNRGLAGQLDADTGKVTLWATTADGTKLEQVTDNGSPGSSSFSTLATAPTNDVFRGVALSEAASPEPGVLGVIAIAALSALRRRRTR